MAEIIDIADAVVTEINATTFTAPYDSSLAAVRAYLPRYKLEDMDTLHVTVVPKGVAILASTSTRAHQLHEFQIDVAVQQKPTDLTNANLDPLMTLAEEITDHFRMARIPAYTSPTPPTPEHPTLYSPEHLEKFRQFTSVVTLTFRKMR